MYHDAYTVLPPGSHSQYDAHYYWSWLALILPYMEEGILYAEADSVAHLGNGANYYTWGISQGSASLNAIAGNGNPGLGAIQKNYICPMEPRSAAQLNINNPSITGVNGPIAYTEYLGNSGTNGGVSYPSGYQDSGSWHGGSPKPARDGVFWASSTGDPPNGVIRLTDITDGTSSTIMAGERPPSLDLNFGWYFAGWGYNGSSDGDVLMGSRDTYYAQGLSGYYGIFDQNNKPCSTANIGFRPGTMYNPCDETHWWSNHPNGGNFLMSDGSVHFLDYSIDANLSSPVFPALCTRAGGETVSLP
jgi:hypothetical protein